MPPHANGEDTCDRTRSVRHPIQELSPPVQTGEHLHHLDQRSKDA
jgi:hypothetical protein